MALILNNEILFPMHKVVCLVDVYTPQVMVDVMAGLSPDGDPSVHRAELEDMNNDGSWTVEFFVPTTYLSASDSFTIIHQGMPVCAAKGTKAEALKAAEQLRLNLAEVAWDGQVGGWVMLNQMEN